MPRGVYMEVTKLIHFELAEGDARRDGCAAERPGGAAEPKYYARRGET